jgi:acetate kinase
VKVLVINAGSSSLKFTMFRMTGQRVLAKGLVERIGLAKPNLIYQRTGDEKTEEEVTVANHGDALVDKQSGVLKSLSEVQAIGHRVVHGGERFTDPVVIDDAVKSNIRLCSDLAPLHNPPNLGGIEACERAFPGIPNIAVFDTAFHQTMPPSSFMFALPRKLYEEYGIRKYGFHGTSRKFVFQSAADYLSIPRQKAKLITCHLGNGASIAAVNGGHVLDTSMGMTPLMGLVMGTRCGDIDPAVVLYLLKQGMSGDQIDKILNKESGLLGVSGALSSDMRDIIAAKDDGNQKAQQAFDVFVQRLVSYIGSYYTLLGGADAVVMTGGIGENSAPVREAVLTRLEVLGCFLDREANKVMGEQAIISTPDSTLLAVVAPTNEELMIALETVAVLS